MSMIRTFASALLVLCFGCGDRDSSSDDLTTASSGAASTQGSSASSGSGMNPATSGTSSDSPAGSDPESGSASSATADAASGAAEDTSTDLSGGAPPEVAGGVFLWTGSGGGGPGTDLYPNQVLATLTGAGVDTELGDTLPVGFERRFGTLVYLNPRSDFDPTVDAAALDLVEAGGRLVLVMEHCKNGCWGNAEGHNELLGALGSSLSMVGDGGAPLSDTALVLTPTPPLTDGVSDLVVYYSGHVELGASGVALGAMDGGEAIVGFEPLGWGEVVAIADSSMLGYRLAAGDNALFLQNWGQH
jgi:hypothetical protein